MTDNERRERLAIEKLRVAAKERHFTRANLWNEEVNKTEVGLRSLLFSLAVFLFTFTSPIFLEIKDLSQDKKLLFFLAWVLLISSLIAGLIQIVLDIRYLFKGAERESRGERMWSKAFIDYDEYNLIVGEQKRLYEDFSSHSGQHFLILQATFLLLALLLIFSGASLILFR